MLKEEQTSQVQTDTEEQTNPIEKKIKPTESGIDETKIEKEFFNRFMTQRGFITNENWTKSILMSGRIVNHTKNIVNCECIIYYDEEKDFQIRQFPNELFKHLEPLKNGQLVKIKLNQKPGSYRVDIYDGKNLGIEKDFEVKDLWDELEDYEMDSPES